MRAVTEIQTEHINTGPEQGFYPGMVGRGRAERGDNFCPALPYNLVLFMGHL